MTSKIFNSNEAKILADIIHHRRDVRGNLFSDEPVSDDDLNALLNSALEAPSVGFSQPWEFVIIRDSATKTAVRASFLTETEKGKALFDSERQKLYAQFRLEGVVEAPINLAIFHKPTKGPTLGATSMTEMEVYSVVCAVQNIWLTARSLNIGVGWLSIISPDKIKSILNAPKDRTLVAYLCVGHVKEFLEEPELQTAGWDYKKRFEEVVFNEGY